MSPQRILGVLLLVVGVILLAIGVNASDSVVDQLKETFTGKFTDKTTWYIIGGAAMSIVGLLLTFFGVRKAHA